MHCVIIKTKQNNTKPGKTSQDKLQYKQLQISDLHFFFFCMNKKETRTDFSPELSEDRRESSYSGNSVLASMTTVTTI